MSPNLELILESLKQKLSAHYGERLVNLTLFGSQARGDQQAESDIDILVVLRPQNSDGKTLSVNPVEEIKRTGKIVADLSLEYDVVISCLFMDELNYQTRNSALLRNIRQEGVLL
ncbi:hypothetical protein NIES970_25680 [[Synechococcus] sp. NIES-970]|nr:hypothetical protein NIES970_25680 [[Synechococcus] sp. NIES-970]